MNPKRRKHPPPTPLFQGPTFRERGEDAEGGEEVGGIRSQWLWEAAFVLLHHALSFFTKWGIYIHRESPLCFFFCFVFPLKGSPCISNNALRVSFLFFSFSGFVAHTTEKKWEAKLLWLLQPQLSSLFHVFVLHLLCCCFVCVCDSAYWLKRCLFSGLLWDGQMSVFVSLFIYLHLFIYFLALALIVC